MKSAITLIFYILLSGICQTISGQNNFLFTTSAGNTAFNYSVINLPSINNKPDAIFGLEATPAAKEANPHPIGVWYNGTNWTVFNQDKANMPIGLKFKITISNQAVLQKASAINLNNDKIFIDAPPLNGNPGAKFNVTQNWNPGTTEGIYNASDLELSFNNDMGKWIIRNKTGNNIPLGAAFNIVAVSNDPPQEINDLPASPPSNPPSTEIKNPTGIINPGNLSVLVNNNRAGEEIYNYLVSLDPPRVYSSNIEIQPKEEYEINGLTAKKYTVINYKTDNIVFNPRMDLMYAGAMIQGKPFFERNELVGINKPVQPGTITVSNIQGPGNGELSRKLNEVSKADYESALRNIMSGINPRYSTGSLSFDFKECRHVTHGLVEAGVNIRYTSFTADASISNVNNFDKSTVIGTLIQKYYTVSYEPPSDKKNFFKEGVTLSQLKAEGKIAPDNRPAYISEISYGRIFIMIAESETSADSLRFALNAAYSGAALQVEGRLRYENFKRNHKMHIKIFTLGDNGASVNLGDISPESFNTFLQSGATANQLNMGAPVSFVTRDIVTGQELPTRLTADYSDIISSIPEETYQFEVKPGGCNDCLGKIPGGFVTRSTDGKNITLQSGDIVSFQASGLATHGAWFFSAAKGPEGSVEKTDPNDPIPYDPDNHTGCPRYALLANINGSIKCIGRSLPSFVVDESWAGNLAFSFNDWKTDDGEGTINVTVHRKPKISFTGKPIARH